MWRFSETNYSAGLESAHIWGYLKIRSGFQVAFILRAPHTNNTTPAHTHR